MALSDTQAYLDQQVGESARGYLSAADVKSAITNTYADLDYHRDLKVPVGNSWVTAAHTSAISLRVSGSAILWPIWIPTAMTIDRVAFYVSVASSAGQTQRVAFYNNHSSGIKPSTLIADCGTVASDSTGYKSITGLSVTLPRGWVWGAVAGISAAATVGTAYAGMSGITQCQTGALYVSGSLIYTSFGTGAAPADLSAQTFASGVGAHMSLEMKRTA